MGKKGGRRERCKNKPYSLPERSQNLSLLDNRNQDPTNRTEEGHDTPHHVRLGSMGPHGQDRRQPDEDNPKQGGGWGVGGGSTRGLGRHPWKENST